MAHAVSTGRSKWTCKQLVSWGCLLRRIGSQLRRSLTATLFCPQSPALFAAWLCFIGRGLFRALQVQGVDGVPVDKSFLQLVSGYRLLLNENGEVSKIKQTTSSLTTQSSC